MKAVEFKHVLICMLLAPSVLLACDKETGASNAEVASAASENGEKRGVKTASAEAPARGEGQKALSMDIDVAALPTGKLEPTTFIDDPCVFANSEELRAFLKYLESDLAKKTEERADRGQCSYTAPKPETKLAIWFDSDKKLRSSEEQLELAGVADVKLRVLSKAAQLSIPFPQARDKSKRPADRLVVELDLYYQGNVQSWDPAYRTPSKDGMSAVVKAVGASLIKRLGLH
jgi:hypothetical protein